jgi:hypothetical protein
MRSPGCSSDFLESSAHIRGVPSLDSCSGISDAYYCAECTRLEKDRDGCPKIVNLGASRTDLFYERRRLGAVRASRSLIFRSYVSDRLSSQASRRVSLGDSPSSEIVAYYVVHATQDPDKIRWIQMELQTTVVGINKRESCETLGHVMRHVSWAVDGTT